jgi:hypothetical protein
LASILNDPNDVQLNGGNSMTTDLINPKTTKLRLVGLLMATALVATACGGGGGGDAAPPAGSPPTAGSPPAASDVATLADIEACPAESGLITSSNWYTKCLVGKRLVGKDTITGEACELRLQAGGMFEYVKNGAVIYSTKFSDWKNTDGSSNASGTYNNLFSAAAGNFRTFSGTLRGFVSDPTASRTYRFRIEVQDNKTFPNDAQLNDDKVEFEFNNITENCKLNNI